MTDLTQYSDQELSLHVFKDEDLYNMIHDMQSLQNILRESFIYTEDQLNILVEDILDEFFELNKLN